MRTPAFLDPDAPFDRERPEVGPDGLTDVQRRSNDLAKRLLVPLLAVFLASFLVFYVLYDFSKVDGSSMYPTLHDGDHVLITKGVAGPKRGDVVVLSVIDRGAPAEWIKRIVALAGDRVSVRGDVVTVNGAPESFRHQTVTGGDAGLARDLVVPAGTVYCMGDDRPVSLDSRYVGPFAVSQLHGRVVAVYSPMTRIRLVPGP
jgi:signal peptidase I